MRVPLARLAHARSGDKGDRVDLGLFPNSPELYPLLVTLVTAEVVSAHFGCPAVRYELPGLPALKFVLAGALPGGAARTLRGDNLGKAMGPALLRLAIDVPEDIAWRP